jgi:two-component sensor histidine kinase
MTQHYRTNLRLKVGVHFLIWSLLFLFPYLVMPEEEVDINRLFTHTWIPLIQYGMLFYFNYFFLLPRLLFRKKHLAYILLNSALILFFLWLYREFHDAHMRQQMALFPPPQHRPSPPPGFPMPPPRQLFILKDLFSLMVAVIFSLAVKAMENLTKTEAEKKEIEHRSLESELLHLKYQLQPHFFFNSLNNIYSLIEVSPDKAQEAVHNLSKLMRYLLYDTRREKVELAEELLFLKKYIQLMELRHTDRTTTHVRFPENLDAAYTVAPLLFIPMIENAYKHGVSATQESQLSFEMTIQGNELLFSSENTNFPKNNSDKSGSGIGLDNLSKRLELLYPHRHELKSGIRDNKYWITLKISLNGTLSNTKVYE